MEDADGKPAAPKKAAKKAKLAAKRSTPPPFDGHIVICDDCGRRNRVRKGAFREVSLTVHIVERERPLELPRNIFPVPALVLYLRYIECSHCGRKVMLNTFDLR